MNFIDLNDPEMSEAIKVSEVRVWGRLRQKKSIYEAAGSAEEADDDIKEVVAHCIDTAFCEEFPDYIHDYREGHIVLTREPFEESDEYVHFEFWSYLRTTSQQYPTPFTIHLDCDGTPLRLIMELPRKEGYLADTEDDSTLFADASLRVMYTEQEKIQHSMQMLLMSQED